MLPAKEGHHRQEGTQEEKKQTKTNKKRCQQKKEGKRDSNQMNKIMRYTEICRSISRGHLPKNKN